MEKISKFKIVLILLAVCGGLAFLAVPNYLRKGSGSLAQILYNLRQIEGAKDQWAIDHGRKTGDLISESDLAPYLEKHPVRPSTMNERYRLKLVGESPEAEVTERIDNIPVGTIIRFGSNGGMEEFLVPQDRGGFVTNTIIELNGKAEALSKH